MNTENTREEDLIDLGIFTADTKGQISFGPSDSTVAPTRYPGAGLTDD